MKKIFSKIIGLTAATAMAGTALFTSCNLNKVKSAVMEMATNFITGLINDYMVDMDLQIDLDGDGTPDDLDLSVLLDSSTGNFSGYSLEDAKTLAAQYGYNLNLASNRAAVAENADFSSLTPVTTGTFYYDQGLLFLEATYVKGCDAVSEENPAYADAMVDLSAPAATGDAPATATAITKNDNEYEKAKGQFAEIKTECNKKADALEQADKNLDGVEVSYVYRNDSEPDVAIKTKNRTYYAWIGITEHYTPNRKEPNNPTVTKLLAFDLMDADPEIKDDDNWFQDLISQLSRTDTYNNPDDPARIAAIRKACPNVEKMYSDLLRLLGDSDAKGLAAADYAEKILTEENVARFDVSLTLVDDKSGYKVFAFRADEPNSPIEFYALLDEQKDVATVCFPSKTEDGATATYSGYFYECFSLLNTKPSLVPANKYPNVNGFMERVKPIIKETI